MFEAEQDLKSVERFKGVLKKQRTSSVDDKLPGRTTDRDRGDVSDVFVCDRARADIGGGADGGDAVDLVDTSLAFGNDILDRLDVGDVLQRQNGGPGLQLDRRCRDRSGSNSKKGDEEHGVGRGKTGGKVKLRKQAEGRGRKRVAV